MNSKTLAAELRSIAPRILAAHGAPWGQTALDAAGHLVDMHEKISSLQKEVAFLRMQRDKAIRALMAQDCPGGEPTCPRDMSRLDTPRNYMGFKCVLKEYPGWCPLDQTESEIFDCWTAWLEGREVG